MTTRRWLNIVTLGLIVLILFFARHELTTAFHMLIRVNAGLLLLVIPLQFLSYYANGATVFSYLRSKGELKNVRSWEGAKMSLELNFVNHILPSGGVSGVSYMTWRLAKLGVNSSRATLAQVVRYGATFIAFAALLVVAVIFITFDGSINRFTILVSCGLVGIITLGMLVVGYAMGSGPRLKIVSRRLYIVVHWISFKFLRRKRDLISLTKIEDYFANLHTDYVSLRQEPRQLTRSFWWGVVFNLAETSMFFVTFLSLGTYVNPAPILIALGLGGLVGAFLPTPGGTGGYETLVILFLTTTGVDAGVALAGVLLTRVILIILTIGSGYVFYHHALKKYGEKPVGRHTITSQ